MEAVAEYVLSSLARTCVQLLLVFGYVFVLAVMLWFVSQGIRSMAASRFGKAYYYFVAPGVVCHETGHAIGCILTRTKIVKFVPFRPQKNGTLGYVSHAMPDSAGIFGGIAQFIIATGPVWFGSCVILALSFVFGGSGFLPSYAEYCPGGASPASADYAAGLLFAAFDMLRGAACVWKWHSAWIALYVYAAFCVASEITLSGPDLKSMWKGSVAIIALFAIVNLVPFVSAWADAALSHVTPWLFLAHSVLAFVLLLDMVFFVAAFLLTRFLPPRQP